MSILFVVFLRRVADGRSRAAAAASAAAAGAFALAPVLVDFHQYRDHRREKKYAYHYCGNH